MACCPTQQLRKLADIARKYDRGYGHFSTRQNLQLNWPKLEQVPDILAELATRADARHPDLGQLRSATSPPTISPASRADEIVDSFVWCEIIRQWSTFHPEFTYLPRKFKFAVNGARADRAAVGVHDIGLHAIKNEQARSASRCWSAAASAARRSIGFVIREFLPWPHLLTYLEAILRVYNRYGRRDNIHKARIKILVKERGAEKFREEVEAEWAHLKDGPATLTARGGRARRRRASRGRSYEALADQDLRRARQLPGFAAWLKRNVHPHKVPGYAAVTLSLKKTGVPPGDVTSDQMEAIAESRRPLLLRRAARARTSRTWFSPTCARPTCVALWREARALGLATPNIGLLTNIIACPGGDFCSLANAKSIPVAEAIQRRFDDLDYLHDIGELDLNISGCMNACGHHHVGHIGILGVDKNGEEWYQIRSAAIRETGPAGASLGKVIGPSFARADVPDVDRKPDRVLSRAPRQRSGALHRRRAPHRHRTLQGTASMARLIKGRRARQRDAAVA